MQDEHTNAQQPEISICLPVYNGAKYLRQAIESALSQTYADFELLISDDGSSDDSVSIAQEYADKDKRVIAWRNEQNLGLFENYNLCMERARGKFIKLFAQDDVFAPKLLEKMRDALLEEEGVSLVVSGRKWIDAEGKEYEPKHECLRRIWKPFPCVTRLPGKDVIAETLRTLTNWIGEPSTVMFRKEHQGEGFDCNFRQIGDLELWYRILQQGDYFYLSEQLCHFRQHPESTTNKNKKTLIAWCDAFLIGEKHKAYFETIGESEETYADKVTQFLGTWLEFDVRDQDDLLWRFLGVREEERGKHASVLAYMANLHRDRGSVNQTNLALAVLALREIGKLVAARDENIALKNEVEELRDELTLMGESTSWRITAPLREVSKILTSQRT